MNELQKTIAVLQDKKFCSRCKNNLAIETSWGSLPLCFSCEDKKILILQKVMKRAEAGIISRDQARKEIINQFREYDNVG